MDAGHRPARDHQWGPLVAMVISTKLSTFASRTRITREKNLSSHTCARDLRSGELSAVPQPRKMEDPFRGAGMNRNEASTRISRRAKRHLHLRLLAAETLRAGKASRSVNGTTQTPSRDPPIPGVFPPKTCRKKAYATGPRRQKGPGRGKRFFYDIYHAKIQCGNPDSGTMDFGRWREITY